MLLLLGAVSLGQRKSTADHRTHHLCSVAPRIATIALGFVAAEVLGRWEAYRAVTFFKAHFQFDLESPGCGPAGRREEGNSGHGLRQQKRIVGLHHYKL